MTALVMSSEVDLAVERIMSNRNPSSTHATVDTMDIDSDMTSTSEEVMGNITQRRTSKSLSTPAAPTISDRSIFPQSMTTSTSSNEDFGKRDSEEINKKIEETAKVMLEYLVDDAILNLAFEVHRAAKTGLFFVYDSVHPDDDDLRMVDGPSLDIFGQSLISTAKTSKALAQLECVCPHCHQPRLACRFAPHLEKCMGMGRNSSRLASRRLAAAAAANAASNSASSRNQDSTAAYNGKESSDDGDGDEDQFGNDDDDDDDDWTLTSAASGSGAGAFGKKKAQRKRASNVGTTSKTPRKRGGNAFRTPKKMERSTRSSGALIGDLMLNESTGKSDGGKRMKKVSSYGKLPVGSAANSQQPYDFDLDPESAVGDFLSLTDTYDPPSPSF